MDGVKWRWGRVLDEGREWPTFRLPQCLIDLQAPEYGLRERVILAGLIAWSQTLDGVPGKITPPKGYLAKLTGSHDRQWVEQGIDHLSSVMVTVNRHNTDRRMGRQRRCAVIHRVADEGVMFDDAIIEHVLWPRQYAFVELATVAGLKSKYAAALYPLLCMQAGRAMSETHQARFDIAMLKDALGHQGSFAAIQREALAPAIRDIREHGRPHRFTIPNGDVDAIRGIGRGRPVVAVSMTLQVPVERLSSMDRVSFPVRRRMEGWKPKPYRVAPPPGLPGDKVKPEKQVEPAIEPTVPVPEPMHEADAILFGDLVDERLAKVSMASDDEDGDAIPY